VIGKQDFILQENFLPLTERQIGNILQPLSWNTEGIRTRRVQRTITLFEGKGCSTDII